MMKSIHIIVVAAVILKLKHSSGNAQHATNGKVLVQVIMTNKKNPPKRIFFIYVLLE